MNDPPNRDVVIFTEAVQLPADQRADYLASACGWDAELRQKVETLLHTHDHVGDFLEASPQKASLKARVASSTGEKAGDRIGRYKLLQQIGEGDWGVVFMAEQEEPVLTIERVLRLPMIARYPSVAAEHGSGEENRCRHLNFRIVFLTSTRQMKAWLKHRKRQNAHRTQRS